MHHGVRTHTHPSQQWLVVKVTCAEAAIFTVMLRTTLTTAGCASTTVQLTAKDDDAEDVEQVLWLSFDSIIFVVTRLMGLILALIVDSRKTAN